jgi:hypothetical protein
VVCDGLTEVARLTMSQEANLLLLLRLREEASELDPVGQRVPLIGLYQRVLRLREAQGIEESEEVLDILNKLGGALTDEGREAEAIPLMEKTLEMTERLFPSQRRGPNPRMASLLNNMAVAYRKEVHALPSLPGTPLVVCGIPV